MSVISPAGPPGEYELAVPMANRFGQNCIDSAAACRRTDGGFVAAAGGDPPAALSIKRKWHMKLARTVTSKLFPAMFLVLAVLGDRDLGAQETAAPSALEAAVTRESEATVKAFNAADAAALGGMFLETGELVDEAGTVHVGKAAITELFKLFFAKFPQAMLEMQVASVRPVGDTLAVEEGQRRS